MSASPHQLIAMLFDGAAAAIQMARLQMARSEIAAKGKSISKAIDIIDNGLKASLDPQAGGPAGAKLAADLSALYDYINQRLLYANLRNDPELLEEAARLLENIASAWRDIAADRGGPAVSQAMASTGEVLTCYRRLAELTRQMLGHARREEWGSLPALEEQCSALVRALQQLEPDAELDSAQRLEKYGLLQGIHTDHDEVRAKVGPQLLHLREAVLTLQRQRLLRSYEL